jgi:hypothetical protein
MKVSGGVDVYSHIYLTSALAGVEWSGSRPGRFIPGERAPGTHWKGGYVGLRDGLDALENRPLGCSAHSQSLYRLRYPGSPLYHIASSN